MTSVDQLLAALQGIRETVPHQAAEEYHTRMESIQQQVNAAIRTSRDETELLGVIVKASEEGAEQIRTVLGRLDQLIETAGNHW